MKKEIKYYCYDIIIAKYKSVTLYAVYNNDGTLKYKLEDLDLDYDKKIINENSSYKEFYEYCITI